MNIKIQLHVKAANRFEAIEAAAFPFILNHFVKDDFVKAVCQREREFPTGLPTKIGVAIPHAEPEHVIEEAISIAVLEKPVIFHGMGAPEEKIEAAILFLLAIKDGEKQIEWLQKIVMMIQDEMVLHKIIGAKNEETIYNLIINQTE
ncbi:MAG: PTS sugar transporter subunit IIA [Eubacterium sp.]